MILVSDNDKSTEKGSTRKADRDLVHGLIWFGVFLLIAAALFVFVVTQ